VACDAENNDEFVVSQTLCAMEVENFRMYAVDFYTGYMENVIVDWYHTPCEPSTTVLIVI